MQPFKVEFIYEEILRETEFNRYAGINELNLMWQQAFHDVHGQNFIQWGQQHLYPHCKFRINEHFKEDYKEISFDIDTVDHEFITLGYKGQQPYNKDGYSYETKVIIASVSYTCIGILPDKTFICVDDGNEIKYISGTKTRAIFQSPTL